MSIAWLTNPGSLAEPEQLTYSDSESWDDGKLTARVSLLCPWADRYNVLSNILLNQKEWPYLPGSDIRAVNGGIRPFQQSLPTTNGSGVDYNDAQVDVVFENAIVKNNAPGGGTAVYSETFEPTAEFLTLPYNDFRWSSSTGDALKKDEAPGRLEIGFDYQVTWNNLRAIPTQVLTLIGCVNDRVVQSPSYGLTFDPETLLFNPPKLSRTVNLESASLFQMSCRWTYRKTGWNKFWRAKVGEWQRMYHKDSGDAPYYNFQLADMRNMLP